MGSELVALGSSSWDMVGFAKTFMAYSRAMGTGPRVTDG